MKILKNGHTLFYIIFVAIVCAVLGGIISKNNIKSDVENSESNHRSVPADDVSFANQSQEIIITDKASIEKICKEYGIGNTEEIEKMIYIPLKEQSKDLKMTESNNLYFIKQLGFSENIEHLIFSSWYMAPGGFRESSEIFETKFTFRDIHSIRGGKSTLINLLSQSYKFESLKFIPKSAIQSVEVKSAHKKNMKALLCEISYEYEVWEEKLTGERKVGNGTLKKPEGILFILSVDIPAK